jgi:hypothetical protein
MTPLDTGSLSCAPKGLQFPPNPMITNILIVLAAVLVILVVIIVRRPSAFQVTRSAKISAPAAEVFSHVNDFHEWEAWSPWAKRDPEAKNT